MQRNPLKEGVFVVPKHLFRKRPFGTLKVDCPSVGHFSGTPKTQFRKFKQTKDLTTVPARDTFLGHPLRPPVKGSLRG